jgi:hypothetical protein
MGARNPTGPPGGRRANRAELAPEAAALPLRTLPLPPVLRAFPRPATPSRRPASTPPQARSGMEKAQGCVRSGGSTTEMNQCIVNALQDRATTEAELRLLCVTWRQMGDRGRSVACMRRYLMRYADTRYATQFGEYILRD